MSEACALDHLSHLLRPGIRLFGSVDETMLANFFGQLETALNAEGPIVLELTTSGGQADLGRRIALQIRFCREHLKREMLFLGTTTVYSAGVTIMAGFPRTHRYLARDAILLIHGRRVVTQEIAGGSLQTALRSVQAKVAEFEQGIQIEREGFAELIQGTDVSEDEIRKRSETDWYLTAEEALERGLVAGLL
jgi:ATP-dependent protease ClpP protease subunit